MTEKEAKPTMRKRGLLQYSLRSLLLLMLASSLALGWASNHLRSYQMQAKTLKKVSDKAVYIGSRPGRPAWLVRFTDKESYRDITHLSFHNVPSFGDADIVHLKRFPHLQLLSLHLTSVSDEGLAHLKNLRALHTLSIKYTKATDDCLVYLAQMQKMKKLQLSGSQITGAGLANLPDMPELEFLELNDLNITDDDIVHLTRFPKLRHLQLLRTNLSGPALAQLSQLPELETLYVESKDIKQLDLSGFPKLEELSVVSGGYDKVRLENMPALQRLYLGEHPPTETDFALQKMELQLIELPHLKHYRCPDTVTRLTLDDLEKLEYLKLPTRAKRVVIPQSLPNLKDLHFYVADSAKLDLEAFALLIKQAPNVKKIDIFFVEKVDGEVLKRINSSYDFETLRLTGGIIEQETLANLKDCNQLRALEIYGSAWNIRGWVNFYQFGVHGAYEPRKTLIIHSSSVATSAMIELAGFKNLRHLGIETERNGEGILAQLASLTNLQILQLGNLEITDEDMKSLNEIASLETLELGRIPISDAGLKYFANHPHLQTLFLTYTKTSLEANAASFVGKGTGMGGSMQMGKTTARIDLQSQEWKDFINENPPKEK